MSLRTDIIFVKALSSNDELIGMLPAKGIYNTAIPLPDKDKANVPLPLITVSLDGVQNNDQTKDTPYEGQSDQVTIGVEVVAETREQVGTMAEMVRETVRTYFEEADPEDEDFELVPSDYQFGASGIGYDPDKPCYYQLLTYQCDTNI